MNKTKSAVYFEKINSQIEKQEAWNRQTLKEIKQSGYEVDLILI